MSIGHGKKQPITAGADTAMLRNLSKAALVDLAVEQLRLNNGACDTPLTAAETFEAIEPLLTARGDCLSDCRKMLSAAGR